MSMNRTTDSCSAPRRNVTECVSYDEFCRVLQGIAAMEKVSGVSGAAEMCGCEITKQDGRISVSVSGGNPESLKEYFRNNLISVSEALELVSSLLKTASECAEQGVSGIRMTPDTVLMDQGKPVVSDFSAAAVTDAPNVKSEISDAGWILYALFNDMELPDLTYGVDLPSYSQKDADLTEEAGMIIARACAEKGGFRTIGKMLDAISALKAKINEGTLHNGFLNSVENVPDVVEAEEDDEPAFAMDEPAPAEEETAPAEKPVSENTAEIPAESEPEEKKEEEPVLIPQEEVRQSRNPFLDHIHHVLGFDEDEEEEEEQKAPAAEETAAEEPAKEEPVPEEPVKEEPAVLVQEEVEELSFDVPGLSENDDILSDDDIDDILSITDEVTAQFRKI